MLVGKRDRDEINHGKSNEYDRKVIEQLRRLSVNEEDYPVAYVEFLSLEMIEMEWTHDRTKKKKGT